MIKTYLLPSIHFALYLNILQYISVRHTSHLLNVKKFLQEQWISPSWIGKQNNDQQSILLIVGNTLPIDE